MAFDKAPPARTLAGRYELVRPIGSGGAGTVYEAVDHALERRVAVKILHAATVEGAAKPQTLARFLREGRAESITRSGALLGTPGTLAPELLRATARGSPTARSTSGRSCARESARHGPC